MIETKLSLAERNRERARIARKEIELPVPLPTDPDFKFVCVVRRLPENLIITQTKAAGLVESFVNEILGTVSPDKLAKLRENAAEAVADTVKGLTIEDLEAIQRFYGLIAQATCLEPKIVFEPSDDENALDLTSPEYAHCAREIIMALYSYGMKLSPDVPVPTKDGGETSLEAVTNFPDGAALSNPLHNGEAVREAAVGIAAVG